MTRVLRDTVNAFLDQDGFFLAAGLSFYVLICILPFVLLLIAGGGFLLSDERVVRDVLDQVAAILPVYRPDVEQMLRGVVAARGVSGLVGTLVLLLFATQLFAATRLVLNRILGTKGRGFFHGVLFDLGMIVLLTVLFFVATGITAGFSWLLGIVSRWSWPLAVLSEWVGLLLAMSPDLVLFIVLYRFVPFRRVPWSNVMTASAAAAVLWEVAQQGFRIYIERMGVYSRLYGSLGVTIGLIMWVYYSAVVFVLGAALIRALEDRRGAVTEPGAPGAAPV